MESSQKTIKNAFFFFITVLLFLVPIVRIIITICKDIWLVDFAGYCAVSKALFEGKNPFPNHLDSLFYFHSTLQGLVPITYPGQMLFFTIPGFLWSDIIQFLWLLVNVFLVFFLTGITLIKACGYQWHDLVTPGKKQMLYALCCFMFFSSSNAISALHNGQIVFFLTLCLFCILFGDGTSFEIVLFAFIAVTKYSMLTVFAPLLLFKGHWKFCFSAFFLFILFSLSPFLCGNDLFDVYDGYIRTITMFLQSGQVNHYDTNPMMCHLAFFKMQIINSILKIIVVGIILCLFWKERKTPYLTDTLMLLALSTTMLISYHGLYDLTLLFPLLLIRLFDFAQTKQLSLFAVTFLFPLYLIIPSRITLCISSWIGSIPKIGSIVYLSNTPFHLPYTHVFPLTPLFSIALYLWSLYLYNKVKNPLRFNNTFSCNSSIKS